MAGQHLAAGLCVRLVASAASIWVGLHAAGRLATASDPGEAWLTGDVLRTKLAEPLGVSWAGADLRRVCESLRKTTRVCFVLDRRIDPNTKVNWSAANRPLGELATDLAENHGCGLAWIGPVAYLGPLESTRAIPERLAARRREVDALPLAGRTTWLTRRPLEWADFAEPRGTLERMLAEAGLKAVGLELIPFDLPYRMSTPPLLLHERLTLLTEQFTLTYRLDSTSGNIVLERAPSPTAKVPATTAGPPTKTSTSPTAPSSKPPGVPGTQVFTLKVMDVPFDQLIEVLRRKHGLPIRIDEEAVRRAGLKLDGRTSVDVREAKLEALLEQAAAPLGLTAKRTGETIEIVPRK